MPIESPIISMAGRLETANKTEKSQEELRKILVERFKALGEEIQKSLDAYDSLLSSDEFDSEEGEKKKLELQNSLTGRTDRLEKLKAILNSGEDLPQSVPVLSATHTYKNETGEDVSEIIKLSLESALDTAVSLYKTTDIDLPPDFQEQVETIWQNNYDAIVEAVEKDGFN